MPSLPPSASSPAALTASARWVEGEAFLTDGSSGHAVVLDAKRENGTAPGPMEMVLRALCACSAVDVVGILNKARQGLEHVEISATGERAPRPPAVYTAIHMTIRVRGRRLERARVERAVGLSLEKYCSVHAMLAKTARMTHEIVIEPEADAADLAAS